MVKNSQRQRVITQLKNEGFVSRNWALANYISRLSAIILNLKAEGFILEPFRDENDYCYRLVEKPTKTVTQVVEREGKYYPMQVQVPIF